MAKLNIVHLRSAEFFGGPERAIIGQCTNVPDYNFTVASFVRDNAKNIFLKIAQAEGLPTAEIHDAFAGDFRVIAQIKNLLKQTDADILVTHDYKANFFGYFALKGIKIRQIAHFRGYTWEDRKAKFYNAVNAWMLRKMKTILAVSEKSSRILQEMGVPPEVIKVVPNAIEDHKLVPVEFRREVAPPKNLTGICAGRLSFEKGQDVLVDAVAGIKEYAPEFRIDIYGHGPEEENLKKQIAEKGVAKQIKLCGFVDNILPVLKNADFMILPSRSEGMPNILLEAWSQKLAVISTSVGGVPEMITDGVNGVLAPSEDPKRLGELLLDVLQHPVKLEEYGEAGYRTVREKYSYSVQAEILKDIYHFGNNAENK